MNLAVFTRTIRENRKALFWWGLGLAVYVLINIAFYPDFKDQTSFNELLKSDAVKAFSGNVTSFTSPEGYLNAQIFALVAPILLIIYAVGRGTDAVAGEEGRGTLPLLLANPVRREAVVLQKFAAMAVTTAFLALIHFAVLATFAPSFELHIGLANQAAMGTSLFLLALAFGGVGFLLGAATSNRSLATGVSVTLATGTYLLFNLAPLVDAIEPFQKFSPFYYYFQNDPLTNGLDLWHAAALAGTALVCLGLSVLAFRRRDVTA